jgi:hypothetical protein
MSCHAIATRVCSRPPLVALSRQAGMTSLRSKTVECETARRCPQQQANEYRQLIGLKIEGQVSGGTPFGRHGVRFCGLSPLSGLVAAACVPSPGNPLIDRPYPISVSNSSLLSLNHSVCPFFGALPCALVDSLFSESLSLVRGF